MRPKQLMAGAAIAGAFTAVAMGAGTERQAPSLDRWPVPAARALRPRFTTRYQPREVAAAEAAAVVALVAAAALVAVAATVVVALAVVATVVVFLAVAATEELARDREAPVVRADQGLVDLGSLVVRVTRVDRVGLVTPVGLVTQVDRVDRVGLVTRVGPVVRADQDLAALVTRDDRVGLVTPVGLTGLAVRATPVDLLDITATMVTAGTGPTTPTSTTTISTATTASGAGSARGATTLAVASSMPRGATEPHPGVRARRRHRPGTNHFPRRADSGPTAQSTTGDSMKHLLGTHSSTNGASTFSESGSPCKGQSSPVR